MENMKKLLGKAGDALSSSFLTDMLFCTSCLSLRTVQILNIESFDGLSGHGFAADQEGFPAAVQTLTQDCRSRMNGQRAAYVTFGAA